MEKKASFAVIPWIFWTLMTCLCLYLAVITFSYYSLRTDIGFLLAKQDYIRSTHWMTAFYIHITGGILALFTGPFQFVKSLRAAYPKIHRTLGKVYVAAILFLAFPTGLWMSLFANGGLGASLGFGLMSLLWFSATYKAYQYARKGDYKLHKIWMYRSFALTFSAITLRIWVPVLSYFFGMDPDYTVVITAWINWIPNLIVVEILLRNLK
jgi:uncharacterized membrane protein